MERSEFNILIVEDDQTLGKAIFEMVKREGFHPILVNKPADALPQLKTHGIHLALIDCMLPKMNGRDLAVKLRAESGGDMPVILMSGIFKDKAYIRESTQQTGAFAYLVKPFNLDELKRIIEEKIVSKHEVEVRMMPVYNLMAQSTISADERITAINESDTVHGFDLPWLFSLLLADQVKGHLNIVSTEGTQSTIAFDNGRIVQVNMSDQESFFGALLIEGGYISAPDLEYAIKTPGKSKKLGEKLVEMNLLSPHAVSIVLAEQQGIRLAKTIQDTSFKVTFSEAVELKRDTEISRKLFTQFLDDWILSKIKSEWLKASYVSWMNHSFARGSEYSEHHRALTLVNINNLPGFMAQVLKKGMTLQSLLAHYEHQEPYAYRALHMLMTSRLISFGSPVRIRDFAAQTKRFEKINEEMEKQNHFERLGLSKKSKETEIKRAYLDLAKVLHPDKLLPETPLALKTLVTRAFEKVNQAYQVLSQTTSRDQYIRELESGSAELVFKAESMTDDGKAHLRKGDISKALHLFEQAAKFSTPTIELKLLMIWAKLKTNAFITSPTAVQKIKEELSEIPPEDRHTAIYYFIKGLWLRVNDDYENARKSFEHAVSLDTDLIEARRELNLLKHNSPHTKTMHGALLNADLKDVVTMLFNTKVKKAK
jgi:CheY-like chemotaxis protein